MKKNDKPAALRLWRVRANMRHILAVGSWLQSAD